MILGVGVDIVRMERVERLERKYGVRFAARILGKAELKLYHTLKIEKRQAYLAKKFALKEAIAKALGYGIGRKFNFVDITISHDELGKPFVEFTNGFHPAGVLNISVADDPPIVIAFAVYSSE